ncbi:MAG: pilus assembly protein PilM [Planctomycetes bacterium]|nr:pilus assembly protein PilM [Planctomycetota bacterium]
MARSVGVELTPAHVRILSLERAGKTTAITQFHETPIPPGESPWEERAAEAIREACAASRVPKGRMVAALDSGDAILREVSLPFKGDDQIRKTVRFEMESLIHNYTIEQLVVAHYKTGETDKASLLLAAAVPKTVIDKRLKLFQGAGIDPVALDLDAAAVFNAMLHAGAIATDEPLLLVHGTPKFTKLVFIEERRPRSIRTIRFSLGGSPEAAAPVAAEAAPAAGGALPVVLLPEAGAGFGTLPRDHQTALIGILSKEISRFLLANASAASPAHILLSGDFEEDGAAEMLESATRIPVKTFDLVQALNPGAKDLGSSARIAVPLGLALKGAGIDAMGMDFRQEEFQYTKRFEALKTTMLVTVELVIVLLAAVALHFYFMKKDLDASLKTVYNFQKALYDNVTGETLGDPAQAYPKFKELYLKATGGGPKDLPILASAREAWRDLFGALQNFQSKHGNKTLSDGTLFLEVESLDIQQSTTPGNESLTMMMRGKVRNLEFAGLLKNEIRTVDLFANADYVGSMPRIEEQNVHQFTLRSTKGGKQ